MKVEMVMPQMGESITEGTILKWLKKVGDTVERDENILEISTDKVDSEIPSPAAGTIVALLAEEGDTVPVGQVIAHLETAAAAAAPAAETPAEPAKAKIAPARTAPPPAADAPARPPAPAPLPSAPPAQPIPEARDAGARFYSPLVRSIARTEGVSMEDLARISGSGRGGRVTKEDLLSSIASRKGRKAAGTAPAPLPPATAFPGSVERRQTPDGPVDVVPMDHIRQKIAEHMVRSKATSPHVASVAEADMTRIVRQREATKGSFLREQGFKLTYTPFIVQAAVRALREYPMVNASIEGTNILVKRSIHVGLAVAVDYGLIVPVIRDADTLNFLGLARAVDDLAERARTKALKPEDVAGGTFSVTNMGTVGNLFGIPIIAQPQAAILGIGVIQKRPIVRDEAIAIRDMIYLSLSYDHRLIDGATGGAFLQRIAHHLETMEIE